MLSSLRFRLLLTMTLLVLVVGGAITILGSFATADQFRQYLEADIQRDEQVVSTFQASWAKNPTIAGLATLVQELSQTSHERFVVVDGAGVAVADSGGTLIGQTVRRTGPPGSAGTGSGVQAPGVISGTQRPAGSPSGLRFMPVAAIQAPVASAGNSGSGSQGAVSGSQSHFTVMRVQDTASNVAEGAFLDSVNRQLLIVAAAAGAVALLLTLVLWRRILRPLETLTAAAGRMAKGDLSQRVTVKSRDEIGELGAAFNSMSEGLSRLEQARRNMVADVAHELRTPIGNIRGYLELMADGTLAPDENILQSLHGEAVLLSRLVEDLRDLELMDAGKLKLSRVQIDPGEVIENAVMAEQPLAVEKEVDLRAELPADLPAIEADPERIGQVLRNLLSNAITHTPAGGHVEVAAHSGDGEIEVSVSDTGPGISEEHLPHVFERFYRADQSRRRSTGGAGLGLAIVKELVEMHGGSVRAESLPGRGAAFHITLPLKAPSPA